MQNKRTDYLPLYLIILVILACGRSILLNDVIWDDNAWLLSRYSTSTLHDFLGTGFYELRRVPQGIIAFYFFSLHKLYQHTYLVWNSINMAVQIASPLVLYYFIKNLASGRRYLPFFIAATFTVCLLDNTLPYYMSIQYRVATLMAIGSFYLTERALNKDVRWGVLLTALIMSVLSSYALMETTIALEPARLFLILYLLFVKEEGIRCIVRRGVALWFPFLMADIPLIFYKLAYKPYGIYQSIYPIDPFFFLNVRLHAKALRQFMFYNWVLLSRFLSHTGTWPFVLMITTLVASFILARYWIRAEDNNFAREVGSYRDTSCRGIASDDSSTLFPIIFSLSLIIPPLMMYEMAGRVAAPGMEGRHATVLLFGYAVGVGTILFHCCRYLSALYPKRSYAAALITLFIGLGVFFNNVNLDLYYAASKAQKRFWRAFTTRFPLLPAKTSFFMDVRPEGYLYYYADLEAYYELEFPLNILYARTTEPHKFRKYRVYSLSEGVKDEWRGVPHVRFERLAHSGWDSFNTDEMIFVYWRDDTLLVNSEIKERYPDVSYNMWLAKTPPFFEGRVPVYPLRHKLKGFY